MSGFEESRFNELKEAATSTSTDGCKIAQPLMGMSLADIASGDRLAYVQQLQKYLQTEASGIGSSLKVLIDPNSTPEKYAYSIVSKGGPSVNEVQNTKGALKTLGMSNQQIEEQMGLVASQWKGLPSVEIVRENHVLEGRMLEQQNGGEPIIHIDLGLNNGIGCADASRVQYDNNAQKPK